MSAARDRSKKDLNFLHLQAELARIDILIQRQVFHWRMAGQDPQDAFRGLYVSDGEAAALLNRPFAGNWGSTALLNETQAAEFDAALRSVSDSLAQVNQGQISPEEAELAAFYQQRLGAMQAFFQSLDRIVAMLLALDEFRVSAIQRLLGSDRE